MNSAAGRELISSSRDREGGADDGGAGTSGENETGGSDRSPVEQAIQRDLISRKQMLLDRRLLHRVKRTSKETEQGHKGVAGTGSSPGLPEHNKAPTHCLLLYRSLSPTLRPPAAVTSSIVLSIASFTVTGTIPCADSSETFIPVANAAATPRLLVQRGGTWRKRIRVFGS